MKKSTSSIQLKEAILAHELKLIQAEVRMKEQFVMTLNNLKPVNLIKNTFSKLVESPDLKKELINSTLAATSGFLTKKLIVRQSHNPVKQIIGTLLQIGVTSLISNKSRIFLAIGKSLFQSSPIIKSTGQTEL